MNTLTHLDPQGAAAMVDISTKADSQRLARAGALVQTRPEVIRLIEQALLKKGDVLATARIAGIMAAKKTSDLIPLCHPLPLTRVAIDLVVDDRGVTATATAATESKTGVEMEALTAVTVTLLTIYDMAKAIDKGMTIGGVQLLTKTGGKSGDWAR